MLRYLANHSLDHPGVAPKEYQIATEVFGRNEDFDPHLDSMVRVQAGRLRAKLAEYYASEGAADPFLVEMPKGTYALTFSERALPLPEEKSLRRRNRSPPHHRRLRSPFRFVGSLRWSSAPSFWLHC